MLDDGRTPRPRLTLTDRDSPMQSKRFVTSYTLDTVPDFRPRNSAARISDLEPILSIRPTEQGLRPELFITFDADMMPRAPVPRLTLTQKIVRITVAAFFFVAAAACGAVLA